LKQKKKAKCDYKLDASISKIYAYGQIEALDNKGVFPAKVTKQWDSR
jgi:hypothetical protein